jgi:two-component system phosphate regulon sensor histidine kinase PhoR
MSRTFTSRSELLRRLAEIGFDPRATVDAAHNVLEYCAREMGCSFALLWLRDPVTGHLRVLETYGAPDGMELYEIDAERLPQFEGGRALATGRCRLIADVDGVPLASGSAELVKRVRGWGVRVQALAISPLVARGEALGVVTFCWPDPVEWQDGDQEFFGTLATIMAMVVENSALRGELESRVNELYSLLDIASTASCSLDMEAVFPQVLPKIRQLLEADQVGIALLTDDKTELVPTPYLEGYTKDIPPPSHEALRLSAKPWVQEALRQLAPVFVSDYATDPRIGALERDVFPTASATVVPLVAGEHPLGVMFVNWHRGRTSLPHTLMRLLEVIGRQLGRFVANAGMHARAQLQNRYLRAASNIALALSNPMPLRDLLSDICRQVVEALGAALAEVFLLDGDGVHLEGVAIYGPRVTVEDMAFFEKEQHSILSPLLISKVAREGSVVAIADARSDPRITPEWAQRHSVGPVLFLPLRRVAGHCLGVMTLAKFAGQAPFTDPELAMAQGVARQASVAIERTLLHEDQQRAMGTVANLAWLNYLRAAEFDALIRNLTDGVIVLRANGDVDTVNRAAMEVLGVAEEALVVPALKRLTLFDLKGNTIREGLDPLSRVLRGETFRNYVVSADLVQSRKFLSFSGTTIPVEGAHSGLAVLMVSDVTEQHALELARNEFLSELFHDMVTPVTVIKLAAQNALKRIAKGYSAETVLRNLETVVARSDDLARMLRLLTDVSRVDANAVRVFPEWFDLSKALKSWAVDVGIGWPEHRLVLRIQESVTVYADRESIRRILDNLVSNAARHSPAGSEIHICLASEGAWAYMALRDQGSGIRPEHQARVFERYFRGKEDWSGTGLGLYLARKLLEAQGGQIWLASMPGHGTTVFIALPAAVRPSL